LLHFIRKFNPTKAKQMKSRFGIINTVFFLLMIACSSSLFSQPTGAFENHMDIGNPVIKGSVDYNESTQTYSISGGGKNMWLGQDQFHFLYKKIKGDFILSATVKFLGKGTEEHRKLGIMARNQLTLDSRYADACVHGNILTSLQYRIADGDTTGEIRLSSFHPTEIILERAGNTFTFSAATFGEEYKSVSKQVELNEEIYAGLFICSHNENIKESAVFSNVRITLPPPKGYTPYRDYIGSNLEVMDVFSGQRKILHTAPNSLQAPNWTTDGVALIYNEEGLLKRYNLKTGSISTVNTGFANNNNNDHVISFDGMKVAISNHSGTEHNSTIYILPVNGSEKPLQITSPSSGPSYLHGWSTDNKKLVFTGQRNGNFDIWQVDINTKKETRLTTDTTLDDGPEYTPDGKYIYFNSARTGTMQIWRMKPDGSAEEQITFDRWNNWFPHISPDGKWIIYLSFSNEIDASSHPFYQHVFLRLMPAAGGVPRTIAFVFGGQGTINVPSWSPDSRKVAFISNTR
jgi:TolB protein